MHLSNSQASLTDERSQRLTRLAAWREQSQAYPNDVHPHRQYIADIRQAYQAEPAPPEAQEPPLYHIAGRLITRRHMGKVSFADVQDPSGRLQLYLKPKTLSEAASQQWALVDIGDHVEVSGTLFVTKTKELTLHVQDMRLLAKSLYPMPDKFHGLKDHELIYRQRYLDLMHSPESRERFQMRSVCLDQLRHCLKTQGFLEVQTPMLHPIPGVAQARPFTTHHHALDMPLYMRIAPELYLKRLVVGGFERVFEIGRNFRNEGLSTRHNPEFTMLEYYQAYCDHEGMMQLTETLIAQVCQHIHQSDTLTYQGQNISLKTPFKRLTVREALAAHHPGHAPDDFLNLSTVQALLKSHELPVDPQASIHAAYMLLFEKTVESKLIQPTFITDYPAEVSPLARRNPKHPELAERFELMIAGRELANGFSELNDPEDQAARFRAQSLKKSQGDVEAMFYDEDYVKALAYGLPPTAGAGLGIDRLMMLLADVPSIRDVILFPLLKPVTPSTSHHLKDA